MKTTDQLTVGMTKQNTGSTVQFGWLVQTPQSHKGTQNKKVPWHWDKIPQQSFDNVKATIAKDVTMAYPDYTQGFEVYTDSSKLQLGAIISQANRLLAFFSQKLSPAQKKYSMNKQ
jgi:hypothetical protein